MSFLVPKFTLNNYATIMSKDYAGTGADRWSGADIIRLLCREDFRVRFATLDARRLATDLSVGTNETITIGGKVMKLRDCVIALKLVFPTLRCCDYFFRNVEHGTHTGVDIILPKGTPIPAFQAGKVTRVKVRDGATTNEGNCVVIQDSRGYYRGYEHLHRIDVKVGQQLTQGTQVGICGTTGNSTQYHLHVQVDLPSTSPNPHWSTSIGTIQQKTIDPLRALRAAFSTLKDLPYEAVYQDAIGTLVELGYIQGAGGYIFPDKFLQRYEMALILHRILKKTKQYAKLTKVTTTTPRYSDVGGEDSELNEALLWLWQYGLMKGYPNGKFGPFEQLVYEQLLALLGRSFFKLQDSSGASRWQSYLTYFQQHGYLAGLQAKIGKPILRKDCFLVVSRVVK